MIFEVCKSSDSNYTDYVDTIELNSIEELIKFQEKCGEKLIIYGNTIEIYDTNKVKLNLWC